MRTMKVHVGPQGAPTALHTFVGLVANSILRVIAQGVVRDSWALAEVVVQIAEMSQMSCIRRTAGQVVAEQSGRATVQKRMSRGRTLVFGMNAN